MEFPANFSHDKRRKLHPCFYPDARMCILKLQNGLLRLALTSHGFSRALCRGCKCLRFIMIGAFVRLNFM